jgi:protein-disulfide isomerase
MSTRHTRNRPAKTTGGRNRPASAKRPPASRGRQRPAVSRRRARSSLQLWGPIVLLVVAVVAGIALESARSHSRASVAVPAHALGPNGGELLGRPSAPVLVEEYGDFQCPHCRDFQRDVVPTIDRLVDQGKVRFDYHPIGFIGPESTTAANAATCAGDQGKFWQYHDALFAAQGPENSGTFSNAELQRIAQQVGVAGDKFNTCLRNGTYNGWIAKVTDDASRRGVNATPTVLVDGKLAPDAFTAQGLQQAVDSALAAK